MATGPSGMKPTIESVQHSNISEEEMGVLHSIHFSENAIAAVRARMPSGASLFHCIECGDDIPEERRLAVIGCKHCIQCKSVMESRRF